VRWLNGMVTNNIRDLAAGHGVYAFLLNPQGHILGDLYAYNRGESIVVDTDCGQVEKILATFDHYIIMDDVEVKDLSEQLTALGVAGPNSGAGVGRGIGYRDPQRCRALQATCICDVARYASARWCAGESDEQVSKAMRFGLDPGSVRQLVGRFAGCMGAAPVGSEALEMQRIQFPVFRATALISVSATCRRRRNRRGR
jgi:folate-binding Fe-S cluster repair protein YgfZ